MIGSMRVVGFALITLLFCMISAPQAARAATTDDVEREIAVVRVTIQQNDGTVLRATKATGWGEVAQFDLAGHDLDLSVTDREHLGVHYAHNGAARADRSVQTRPRAQAVVYTDGDVKITVQVIPVKVRVHTK